MTRYAVILIAVAMLAAVVVSVGGCAHIDRSSANSTGSAFAVIQQGTSNAEWANQQARKHTDVVGKEWCDAATYSHTEVQLAATAGDRAHSAESAEHWKLVRESRDDHAANKWLGWQTRHFLWLIGLIWAGLGIASIVLGIMGMGGPSAFIMRFLPVSNLFALIRDRIMVSRGQSNVVPVVTTVTDKKAKR